MERERENKGEGGNERLIYFFTKFEFCGARIVGEMAWSIGRHAWERVIDIMSTCNTWDNIARLGTFVYWLDMILEQSKYKFHRARI